MSKTTGTRSRARRLFEVRFPFIYIGLSALWVTASVVRLLDPAHAGDPWSLVFAIVTAVLAVGLAAGAVATIVMRVRGVWPTGPAPLAQESDPRLRHTP